MSTCPHCNLQHGDDKINEERPKSIFKWFGFYAQCPECNRLYFRMWDKSSLATIVLSVVLFQFLASLLVYPLLNMLIGPEVLKIVLFTLFHITCLPVYTLMSISLMLNSRGTA